MTNIFFDQFSVKRYRSLMDIAININDSSPVVICGENNIGKTNLLRALNIFFNHIAQPTLFKADIDIPHHIYEGSRGAGAKTEFTGVFRIGDKRNTIKITFNNEGEATYLLQGEKVTQDKIQETLSVFKFLLVESHNVDLPTLITAILEKDGLLPLDAKRSKQSLPLQKLSEFIDLSQTAISDIERGINQCFSHLTDFDGILKDKKIKIDFVEFESLRDAIKTMTSITLFDGNNHGIASKGSGAQRAVFLSLMQYISKNSKRKIIWGIDEPEAFLQPRLQKKVAEVLSSIVKTEKQPIILTTHSQHFINLSNLSNTYIFEGTLEPRVYARKPGRTYYETNTSPVKTSSDFEKSSLIKQHLGISNNDGWEVLPFNILVEGEEDKKYLETLFASIKKPIPNIIWSGGASKIGGYLQYYNIFSNELQYKPIFVCIFDNDEEGREQSKKVKPKSYNNIEVKIVPLPRYDGKINSDTNQDWEIEDFLSPEEMLKIINLILKKDGYKVITKKQISERGKPAHLGKQILRYSEECCTQNNPDKAPFELDNEGRKKQICQKFCEQYSVKQLPLNLTTHQTEFLKNLESYAPHPEKM